MPRMANDRRTVEIAGADRPFRGGAVVRLTILSVSYPLAPVSPDTAGGAEQILLAIDAYLVREGHRSLVVAPAGSRTRGLLLPISAVGAYLDQEAKLRARHEQKRAIHKALETFAIDVVHLHGLDFLYYLPSAAIPLVITLHLPLDWYPPEALNLKRPNVQLVCVSESQRRGSPLGSGIARVIPNGVASEPPPRVRHKGNYVVSIGRICPEKRFHLTMDAASSCGLPLYLAGECAAYPEHRAYFEREIWPRLKGTHKFLGSVGAERKQHLLAGARALLLPSVVQETSSLVAMEAMSCGTPVIAFPVGALPEIVCHGRTGFLVNSSQEMARAISDVDSLNPMEIISEAAARFPAGRMLASYFELYKDVIQQRSPEPLMSEAIY